MLLALYFTGLLFYTDMQSDFDQYVVEENAAFFNEHYHRAQMYSPFADRALDWFGRERAHEYEAAIGSKDTWDDWVAYEPYILRDADGNKLFFNFACSGGTCTQYADDIGSGAWRSLRLTRFQDSTDRGYPGFWIDNVDFARPNGRLPTVNGNGEFVRPINPRTGEEMINAEWNMYFAEWMELVRSAFPDAEIAHNSVWYAVRDQYVERQHLAADYINLERGFVDYGLVPGTGTYGFDTLLAYLDWVHSLGLKLIIDPDKKPLSEAEFVYSLATYFLIREPGDMLAVEDNQYRAPDSWDTRLETDLGAATGPRYRVGDEYRRDYACGQVIVTAPPSRGLLGTGQTIKTDCEE